MGQYLKISFWVLVTIFIVCQICLGEWLAGSEMFMHFEYFHPDCSVFIIMYFEDSMCHALSYYNVLLK